MNDFVKPFDKPLPLADTPSRDPEFSVPARLADGTSVAVADPRATRAMIALMDMNAVMGGAAAHWGGPAAFAELMSAAHALMFTEARRRKTRWSDVFTFVNDGGHCENGLYALKANYHFADVTLEELKGFRSITSRLTGHGESHLFPEGVLMSNGPLGSALPQAQGLAMADHVARRERVTIAALTDGGAMEGEAREALAALPGLAKNGRVAPFVLIVSDNNTKLTGRIDDESFSMQPTFKALGDLGWNVVELREGHDLQKCVTTIESAIATARANPRQPIVIHARTIKGYGVKKTADSVTGGHGFPLKGPAELPAFLAEIYQGADVPKVFTAWADELIARADAPKPAPPAGLPTQKVQVGVSRALIAKRREGLPVVSISADLAGSTGLAEFQKAFPEATQDIGVAESNMISVAAGFSKYGFIPVVDTFAQFGVTKGALPLTMASLSQAPVIAIFSHVGFQDAADGASHQALSYVAMVSSIPRVRTIALSCSDEAEALVAQAIDAFAASVRANRVPDSYVFFLGRENFPANFGVTDFTLGRAQIVRRPAGEAHVVIAAAGALVPQALLAADELSKTGILATVVNPSSLNHVDVEAFRAELANAQGRLLTVEDHQVTGGMGSLLIHALVEAGVKFTARSLGVRGAFGQSAYNAVELYRKHGLDAGAIAAAARALATV